MKRLVALLAGLMFLFILVSLSGDLTGVFGEMVRFAAAIIGAGIFLSILEDVITRGVARGIRAAREQPAAQSQAAH